MYTRYLYFVRHGRYIDDKGHAAYGALDAMGKKQARLVGSWLATKPIDTVLTSPLPRAIETATLALAASKLPLASKRLLDLRECIPSVPLKYQREPDWLPYLKPRRLKEKQRRLARVFAKLTKRPRHQDRHEVIFAHGNVIRYLCCLALEADADAWINMHINHGSYSVIGVNTLGRIKLHHFNVIDHIPEDLRTS